MHQVMPESSSFKYVSRPVNENNINVTFPLQHISEDSRCDAKTIEIGPQPLMIHVDSPTDFVAVAASVVVGLIGAIIAHRVGSMAKDAQDNQVLASRAAFRRDWQNEFKEFIAKFISTATRIKFELGLNSNYLGTIESNILFCELIDSRVRIDLMLDRSDPKFGNISGLMSVLLDAIKGGDNRKMGKAIDDLVNAANGVVEKTWKDIRSETEVNGVGRKSMFTR